MKISKIQSKLSSMEWVRGDIIGHGSFSTVSLARSKKHGSKIPEIMAVKSSKLSHASILMQEKQILKKLKDCPNIIGCFGGDYCFENGEKIYNLFLEYADGGTLANKLKKQDNLQFLESDIRRYTKSILEGINYIHGKGYAHRDLKLENILLTSSSNGFQNENVKIADFGLARRAGESGKGDTSKLDGTPLYLSPEAVSRNEQEAPADVWALGCLTAEMFSGTPLWRPRPGDDAVAVMMRIALCEEMPEITGNLSPEARDFLGKIFIKDPAKRWTAKMLLDHPFIVDQSCEQATPLPSSPTGPFDRTNGYKSSQWTCAVTKTTSSCKLKKGYCLWQRGLSSSGSVKGGIGLLQIVRSLQYWCS